MAYENLKKRTVEPIVLADFTYDTNISTIDTFDTAPDKYATVNTLSVSDNVLNISTGKPSDIIIDFQDISLISSDPAFGTQAENIIVETDNFIYGGQSISFDKPSGLALTNILIDVTNKGWSVNQFLYHGTMSLYVFLSEEDCSKLSEVIGDKGIQISLVSDLIEYTLATKNYKYTEGWNKIVFDTILDSAISVTGTSAALAFNGLVNSLRIEFVTNNATDTLTGVLLGKIEKSNGLSCDLLESIEEFTDRSIWNDPYANLIVTSGLSRHGELSIRLPKRDTTRNNTMMYRVGMSVNWTRFDILRIDYFVEDADFSKIIYNAMTLKTDDCEYIWRFTPWKKGWNTAYINLRMPSEISKEVEYKSIDQSQYLDFSTYTFNNSDELVGCVFDFLGMTDGIEERLDRSGWIDLLNSTNLLTESDLLQI
jgi:hypothetical protein